ncbi:hypothetical protein NKG05_18875 [Oerskovia sp. M15]
MVGVTASYFMRWDQFISQPVRDDVFLPYLVLSVLVGGAWVGSLAITKTRDMRIVGSGPTEYQRVFDASWRLFAVLAILAFLLRFQEARGTSSSRSPGAVGPAAGALRLATVAAPPTGRRVAPHRSPRDRPPGPGRAPDPRPQRP